MMRRIFERVSDVLMALGFITMTLIGVIRFVQMSTLMVMWWGAR